MHASPYVVGRLAGPYNGRRVQRARSPQGLTPPGTERGRALVGRAGRRDGRGGCAARRGLGRATARPVRHQCDLRAPCRAPGAAADASRNARDAGRDAGRVRTLGSGAWLEIGAPADLPVLREGLAGGVASFWEWLEADAERAGPDAYAHALRAFHEMARALPDRAAGVESVRAAGGSLDQRRGDRRDRRRAGGRAPHPERGALGIAAPVARRPGHPRRCARRQPPALRRRVRVDRLRPDRARSGAGRSRLLRSGGAAVSVAPSTSSTPCSPRTARARSSAPSCVS